MKIAVVTDSNSGITQAQAKEMGITVLPMPFMIDGETYYEDITLTQEQFYQRLKDNSDISTSQPTPDSIMKLWDELLKEYDQIVHIPMSAGLSGSCATAMMLAGEDEYEGKVFVVDNHRISVTQYQSVKDAMMLADMGMDGAQIKKRLEETAADSVIFVTVDTLKYLKKGGRISNLKAAVGTVLQIKPLLKGDPEGKIVCFAQVRGRKKSIELMAEQYDRYVEHAECETIGIAHGDCPEDAEALIALLNRNHPPKNIINACYEPMTGAHVGPGALALFFYGKKEFRQATK